MSEHTPGPWSIVPAPDGDDINIAAPHKTHHLGFAVACAWALWDRDGGRDTQVANARLIAAAPDLLAALKALRQQITFGIEDDLSRAEFEAMLATADAAIAKAEGK